MTPLRLTREEASDWLQRASDALDGLHGGGVHERPWMRDYRWSKMHSPGQAWDLQQAAEQALDRGPVWMRRQARAFRTRARDAMRPGGLRPWTMWPNVRAWFFAAEVLRLLADSVDPPATAAAELRAYLDDLMCLDDGEALEAAALRLLRRRAATVRRMAARLPPDALREIHGGGR